MSAVRRSLALAVVVAGAIATRSPAPAAAAPLASPGVDAEVDAVAGADVDLKHLAYAVFTGGILHQFYDQWFYVATTEFGAEFTLTPRLTGRIVAPLAMMERDGAVDAGWGNLGAAIGYHDQWSAGSARWLGGLGLYVSAPTASSQGDAGEVAREAANVHLGLDMGEYLPKSSTARVTSTLRWQSERVAISTDSALRLHLFRYDQGDIQNLFMFFIAIGVHYRLNQHVSLATAIETTSTVLEKRWADGDLFRHIFDLGVTFTGGDWHSGVEVKIPLDFVLRDDQSPMIAFKVGRRLGR